MKKYIRNTIALSAIVFTALNAGAATPLWLRDAKISPDGSTIVFAYKGDLWKVPANGGTAVRLTATEDYEAAPIWSPDSKSIAYSSNRFGNDDIFMMPANGGASKRLTYNSAAEKPEAFTPDGKYVVFTASIQDPVNSVYFPTSRMTELYQVPVDGGAIKQVLGNPALSVEYIDGGKGSFLYEDMKGMENEWRKHQKASIARDIWKYDASTGKHTNLTAREAEDRNPVSVGSDIYFLSERDNGAFNVYLAPGGDFTSPKAVTSFKTHPVRFLSASDNGDLCFTWDGEIYTMKPNGKPSKVKVDIAEVIAEDPYKLSVGSPSEMTVSPDGKSIAFISRGNVFVTSVDYQTTKQVTDTPEAERWVCWGPDNRTLYYSTERDGNYNIYKASIARDEDPNFANATSITETPVFKADAHERTVPKMSPDGKKLAFILDRNILAVKDMDSGKVTELTDGSTHVQRSGSFVYNWSPDSRLIALEVSNRDPYTDIAIINVDNGQMTNITQSGYFDENPHWALDGNAIIFNSEKYGMRNHASWGSMYDVMIVFLNQKAYDKFKLNKEDAELWDEAHKDEKKDSIVTVETDGIHDRIVRLTPLSTDLLDAVVTSDGKTLFFLSKSSENNMLWELNLREKNLKVASNVSSGLRAFETSADGKKIFLLGSSMQQFNPSGYKLTPITYKATQIVDPAKERQYMYDNIVREERQRFYDKNMHGVDWTKLTDHYRKFLPHINNNQDYSEMVSELLGELNVSHTGCRMYSTSTSASDRTASLGLIYDLDYDGDGLKVAEVVKNSPFDTETSKVQQGTVIEKINGQKITPENDYTLLLADIAGKKTLVSLYDPLTKDRWEEVIKPISASAMNDLLYKRWIAARAADVEKWSNGRLGYVHIKSMNDAAFREVYADLLGKYSDREGVVIDIRWNGGGRLHEDVEVLFTGKKYLTQEIRGKDMCDMPSRRWNKPSVMLMSEACYSNAHGTPWVYKHDNIGKLVGTPVAGTMTSVNWVTMQDPALYFGIPVVGYRTAEGTYLENTQLNPDVRIANDPANAVLGEDAQLRKAVETLLDEIDK